jgi:hypothetical protein
MNILSFLLSLVVVLVYLQVAPPKSILTDIMSILAWSFSFGLHYPLPLAKRSAGLCTPNPPLLSTCV